MLYFVLFLVVGYLCGSLSSAVLVAKVLRLPDPRTVGSNNPGATNMMRIGGKKAAIATFLGDALKGLLPVLFARCFDADLALSGAAIGAFLGHLYPVFFGFKGGKGVATFAGVLLGISPLLFLVFGLVWLLVLKTSGYVSLASMTGAFVATLFGLVFGFSVKITMTLLALMGILVFKHRENIDKLRKGTENSFKKPK